MHSVPGWPGIARTFATTRHLITDGIHMATNDDYLSASDYPDLQFVLNDITNEYLAMMAEDRPSFLFKLTRVVEGNA